MRDMFPPTCDCSCSRFFVSQCYHCTFLWDVLTLAIEASCFSGKNKFVIGMSNRAETKRKRRKDEKEKDSHSSRSSSNLTY